MMELLGNQYSSSVNFREFPGSRIHPVVFTVELSPEDPIHNVTEEIVLLINAFKEFDEAPIRQLVEIIPVGKIVLIRTFLRPSIL